MSFNYRIIHTIDEDIELFDIYEVYYDNDGNITYISDEPVAPFGNSLEELQQDFYAMEVAFSKPVLDMESINYIIDTQSGC